MASRTEENWQEKVERMRMIISLLEAQIDAPKSIFEATRLEMDPLYLLVPIPG